MTREEFSERVAKFMAPEEVADYGDVYEPAYMRADGVGKDDFCAALKDKRARAVIAALGRAFVRRAKAYDELNRFASKAQSELAVLKTAHEAMRSALQTRLGEIGATVDRALAEGWFKPEAGRTQSNG